MKALILSADDIQNFQQFIYDPKSMNLSNSVIAPRGDKDVQGPNRNQTANGNLMAFQYYLKNPKAPNQPATTAVSSTATPMGVAADMQQNQQRAPSSNVANQQLLAQSQARLSQLQLKQPTTHLQHSNFHHQHHHPYYQQNIPSITIATSTTTATASASAHRNVQHGSTQNYKPNHQRSVQTQMPVHALNQNSNFSAASSSTGGATTTASSHAPTQQSNTTGSNLSPPGPSVNARNTAPHSTALIKANPLTTSTAAGNSLLARSAGASNTKKAKTEPILTNHQQIERFQFANTHIVWTEEHWKRVIFQDERKFNLDGPDGFSYYFHDLRNYERTLSQRPRGNSVYVYIIITSAGPVHMNASTTRQKPEFSIETIIRERSNVVSKLGNADFVLQDYNWPASGLPTTQEWLNAEGIKTQKWPTIAHDINIMENIWGWLIRDVYDGGRKFPRKDDLIYRIREAWGRLPMDLITNLYSTLPERITELYYTRGIYTNC